MVSVSDLEKFPIFAGLDRTFLEQVAKLGVRRNYPAGEAVLDEGAPAHFIYLVEKGKIALERKLTDAFHGVAVHTLQERQILGWSALVEPSVHTAGGRCVEDSEMIQISGKELMAVLDKATPASYQFMKRLATVVALRFIDSSNAMMREMADFAAYRSM
jgi:CRP-like cAMP-binding protein